jgi:hypothetical protein
MARELQSDLDRPVVDAVDGCTRYECKDMACLPPRPYAGLAVVSVAGEAETADQADEIGYPSHRRRHRSRPRL